MSLYYSLRKVNFKMSPKILTLLYMSYIVLRTLEYDVVSSGMSICSTAHFTLRKADYLEWT